MALGGRLHVGWAHQMRHREGPALDRGQLRWYRDETLTYRFTAGYVIPSILRSLARVTVEGLQNIPFDGTGDPGGQSPRQPGCISVDAPGAADGPFRGAAGRVRHGSPVRPVAAVGCLPGRRLGDAARPDALERWRGCGDLPTGDDLAGAPRGQWCRGTARVALRSTRRPHCHLWNRIGPCHVRVHDSSLRLRPLRSADDVCPEWTLLTAEPDGRGRDTAKRWGPPGRTGSSRDQGSCVDGRRLIAGRWPARGHAVDARSCVAPRERSLPFVPRTDVNTRIGRPGAATGAMLRRV